MKAKPAPVARDRLPLRFGFARRLPMLHQVRRAECAIACLAMIASYHGERIGIAELRRHLRVSARGSSLATLLRTATRCGFAPRPLRAELAELRRVRTPAILHWRFDHFVVLRRAGRRVLHVHDPAVGVRRLSWQQASQSFTGVAIEMLPAGGRAFGKPGPRLRLADFWSRSTGLARALLHMLGLSVLLQALALLAPLVNQVVVDEAIARADLGLLNGILLGFALLFLSQAVVEALRSAAGLHLGQVLGLQLRSNVLRHLFRLPVAYFEERHVGDLVSRFASLAPLQQLISSAVITVVLDGVLCLATLAVMFAYSPLMATLVLGATGAGFAARVAAFPWVRRQTQERISRDADLQTVFLETLRAIRPLKLFGREAERHARWQNAFVDAANAGIRLQRTAIAAAAGRRLLDGALDAAVYYAGAHAVVDGRLTLGMFFAFQAWRGQFGRAARGLVEQCFAYRTVGIHRERLEDVVHAWPETSGSTVPATGRLRGDVHIEGLSFRFGDGEPWILRDACAAIRAGERVGVVGPSGGGKSTLLKLLLGLYAPYAGVVRYDDAPLPTLDLSWFRRRVGTVMQDDRLLSGSLADNIAFFDEEPDPGRIARAARLACLHDDIIDMPMGYDTLVGDMGSTLSGGQRQRLLLARALYTNPDVLFLDEGTANLDVATERQLLDALRSVRCTQIIVAHRPAAVASCDRILRLANGRLVEAL